MSRVALAVLLATAAPVALAETAWAQAAPEQTGGPAKTGQASAPAAAPAPAADAPQASPATVADQGATPTSGQPDAETREGSTVYRPEFFAASRPSTALDMINRLPGFQFDQGASARGFAGTAGNVLIDGKRPASKSDSLGDILSRIPASQVDRIEVIRGGAPGIDMQGRSVVANVIRRAGNASQQVITIANNLLLPSGDNLPNARYELSRTYGPRSFDFSISRGVGIDDSSGQGTRTRRDPAGVITRLEAAGHEGDGGGLSSKGSVKTPMFGGELRANASLGKSDFKSEDHFTRLDRPAPRLDIVQTSDSVSGEIGLNFTRPLTPRVAAELVGLQRLSRSEFASNSEQGADRSTFTSDAESGESIARGVLRFKRSATLSFEGGGEVAFNFRDGQTAFTVNGAPVPIPNANVRVEERRGEGFVTATWRPLPPLSVEAGSRFESSTISSSGDVQNERSFFYPKPRLLATWTPNKSDTFRLRIEREVGQLNFGDFVASANLTDERIVAGNPELEPDKTLVIEVSAERRFWEKGAIGLSLSHEEITDAIDRVPITAQDENGNIFFFDAPGNIGDATQDELDFNLTLPLNRFGIPGGELKLNLELVESEVQDPTTGEPRRISGQRPRSGRVDFRQDVPRYKLTYGGTALTAIDETYFRFNEVSRVKIRPFYLAAFVEYKPSPRTSILFNVENIGRFELLRERDVFAGPRNTRPLLFRENFDSRSQARAVVRLRRTFQ